MNNIYLCLEDDLSMLKVDKNAFFLLFYKNEYHHLEEIIILYLLADEFN